MEGTKVEVQTKSSTNAWGSPVPANPWGSPPGVTTAMPCSLEDVMSEELIKTIQIEEDTPQSGNPDFKLNEFIDDSLEGTNNSDLLLAQMLQHEFDQEHDNILHKEEAKYNGGSKVKLSFTNFRSVHPALQDSSESDDEIWEEKIRVKDPTPSFNKGGVAGKGKNMISKHDATLSGRKNASRVMEMFPPEFETGDGGSFDMQLPNKVYNNLKAHSHVQDKRSQRLHDKKEHSTAEHAVDPKTRLILYKLINNEILESVNGIISTGKEAVVFHADGGRLNDELVPSECAIKIYKTTLNEFKNRSEYVRGDYRFGGNNMRKQNPRKIIKMWAEKENMNLKRMEKFGIPCPKVVLLRKHILVMQFIGRDHVPAPKLKDVNLSDADLEDAYHQCIKGMKGLYMDCQLVHADLSEFNLLWHNDTLYFIDVSQAVEHIHPHALEFLYRDCVNMSRYFSKKGVHNVFKAEELFNHITELDFTGEGEIFHTQIVEHEMNRDKVIKGRRSEYAFSFDELFDMAAIERQENESAGVTTDTASVTDSASVTSDQ